jgi:hypothetical protein
MAPCGRRRRVARFRVVDADEQRPQRHARRPIEFALADGSVSEEYEVKDAGMAAVAEWARTMAGSDREFVIYVAVSTGILRPLSGL